MRHLAPAFPANDGVHGVHLGLAAGRRAHPQRPCAARTVRTPLGSLGGLMMIWLWLGSVTNSNIYMTDHDSHNCISLRIIAILRDSCFLKTTGHYGGIPHGRVGPTFF